MFLSAVRWYGFTHAPADFRIRVAHGGDAVRIHGNAIRTREGTEVVIEGPILLHDHDDVLDLLRGRSSITACAAAARAPAAARAAAAAAAAGRFATAAASGGGIATPPAVAQRTGFHGRTPAGAGHEEGEDYQRQRREYAHSSFLRACSAPSMLPAKSRQCTIRAPRSDRSMGSIRSRVRLLGRALVAPARDARLYLQLLADELLRDSRG